MGWKFNDNFAQQEAALRKGMARATKTTAKSAKKRAQDNAPVRTGNLRDSAQVDDAFNKRLGVAETFIVFLAAYAKLVHDGTMGESGLDEPSAGFRRAQPFLTDGLAESENDLATEAAKELKLLGVKHVRRYG